jgi:poly(3-hydroxybutyrate) depolymerase
LLIDSKDLMPFYTGLNEMAVTHKFLIAYPNAIGKSWGLDPVKVQNDLAFCDALLGKLAVDCRIDSDRVDVVGLSNGGYVAHRMGQERSKTAADGRSLVLDAVDRVVNRAFDAAAGDGFQSIADLHAPGGLQVGDDRQRLSVG